METTPQPTDNPPRTRINLTTDEYNTTDVTCAAVLMDRGAELIGVEAANFSKQRALWIFDDCDGQASAWAEAYYNQPENVTITIAALRGNSKFLLRAAHHQLG